MTTSFLFFSGKGGVGKTSMACATAVYHADEGRKTLIVTTDPASNLADVFEQPIGHQITPIRDVPNLWAMEIDPDQATEEYKERALAPLQAIFPAEIVCVMEEQLDSPCTAEMAAFDRFTDFMETADYEVVIFDTAPTGHTLRLLELPVEWSQYIEEAAKGSGQTCMGPVTTIQASKAKYNRAITVMRDPTRTQFIFVTQPEATAIAETLRASNELAQIGMKAQQLIVNGIVPPEVSTTSFFRQRVAMQQRYLTEITKKLPLLTRYFPLLEGEIKGVDRLRAVSLRLYDRQPLTADRLAFTRQRVTSNVPRRSLQHLTTPAQILPRLLPPNGRQRLLFFAGKGGVGKTSLACTTAVWLTRQGYRTLLLTTDPAAHLSHVLEQPVGDEPAPIPEMPNLWVACLDPEKAAADYKAGVLNEARERYSPQMLAQMAEELESPCTEEMAIFDRFVSFAERTDYDVIVFDTAPTGHTLRLLELPIDWSQQIALKASLATTVSAADAVAGQRFQRIILLMRNPEQTTFVFITYPEATPIIEAQRAMQELARVGISTGLVIANQVLPLEECIHDYFRARRAMQEQYLAEMVERFDMPILTVPLVSQEIKGLTMLVELGDLIYENRIKSSIAGGIA